jgi:release factor glutamine methyltransferase
MPFARGLGVDISPAALEVARGNAVALGLEKRADFRASDWFAAVPGRYDLIVSNPPYIAADEMPGLAPEVRDWEPHLALTPGGDGLEPYRIIARGAPARLMAGGRLMVEIGPTQGQAVAAMFAAQGLQDIRILPDMDGRDRVVVAVKPGGDEGCGCA